MKILLKLAGILLLIGGLALIILFATGDEVANAEKWYHENSLRLEKSEKDYLIALANGTADDKQKKDLESFRRANDDSGQLVSDRKQNRLIGLGAGAILLLIGISLFATTFFIGKKELK